MYAIVWLCVFVCAWVWHGCWEQKQKKRVRIEPWSKAWRPEAYTSVILQVLRPGLRLGLAVCFLFDAFMCAWNGLS